MPTWPNSRTIPFCLLSLCLVVTSAGCGDDDDSPANTAGSAGTAGSSGSSGTGGSNAGGSSGSGGSSGTGGSVQEPTVGTVEPFADLPVNTEGLAFGKDGFLYTGSQDALWKINDKGETTKVVDLPGPLGMAVQSDGSLVICGKAEVGTDAAAVIWKVTQAGEKSILIDSSQGPFGLTNMIAVGPDDSIVFSDSKNDKVYSSKADGSSVELIADIVFANGVAFAPDAKTVYVSSWNQKKIWSIPRSTDGTFGAAEIFADSIENVDGVSVLATGDLLLVRTPEITRYSLSGEKTKIVAGSEIGIPANGAFGVDSFGDKWFYVTNLLGKTLSRVYIGETGVSLPVQ